MDNVNVLEKMKALKIENENLIESIKTIISEENVCDHKIQSISELRERAKRLVEDAGAIQLAVSRYCEFNEDRKKMEDLSVLVQYFIDIDDVLVRAECRGNNEV